MMEAKEIEILNVRDHKWDTIDRELERVKENYARYLVAPTKRRTSASSASGAWRWWVDTRFRMGEAEEAVSDNRTVPRAGRTRRERRAAFFDEVADQLAGAHVGLAGMSDRPELRNLESVQLLWGDCVNLDRKVRDLLEQRARRERVFASSTPEARGEHAALMVVDVRLRIPTAKLPSRVQHAVSASCESRQSCTLVVQDVCVGVSGRDVRRLFSIPSVETAGQWLSDQRVQARQQLQRLLAYRIMRQGALDLALRWPKSVSKDGVVSLWYVDENMARFVYRVEPRYKITLVELGAQQQQNVGEFVRDWNRSFVRWRWPTAVTRFRPASHAEQLWASYGENGPNSDLHGHRARANTRTRAQMVHNATVYWYRTPGWNSVDFVDHAVRQSILRNRDEIRNRALAALETLWGRDATVVRVFLRGRGAGQREASARTALIQLLEEMRRKIEGSKSGFKDGEEDERLSGRAVDHLKDWIYSLQSHQEPVTELLAEIVGDLGQVVVADWNDWRAFGSQRKELLVDEEEEEEEEDSKHDAASDEDDDGKHGLAPAVGPSPAKGREEDVFWSRVIRYWVDSDAPELPGEETDSTQEEEEDTTRVARLTREVMLVRDLVNAVVDNISSAGKNTDDQKKKRRYASPLSVDRMDLLRSSVVHICTEAVARARSGDDTDAIPRADRVVSDLTIMLESKFADAMHHRNRYRSDVPSLRTVVVRVLSRSSQHGDVEDFLQMRERVALRIIRRFRLERRLASFVVKAVRVEGELWSGMGPVAPYMSSHVVDELFDRAVEESWLPQFAQRWIAAWVAGFPGSGRDPRTGKNWFENAALGKRVREQASLSVARVVTDHLVRDAVEYVALRRAFVLREIVDRDYAACLNAALNHHLMQARYVDVTSGLLNEVGSGRSGDNDGSDDDVYVRTREALYEVLDRHRHLTDELFLRGRGHARAVDSRRADTEKRTHAARSPTLDNMRQQLTPMSNIPFALRPMLTYRCARCGRLSCTRENTEILRKIRDRFGGVVPSGYSREPYAMLLYCGGTTCLWYGAISSRALRRIRTDPAQSLRQTILHQPTVGTTPNSVVEFLRGCNRLAGADTDDNLTEVGQLREQVVQEYADIMLRPLRQAVHDWYREKQRWVSSHRFTSQKEYEAEVWRRVFADDPEDLTLLNEYLHRFPDLESDYFDVARNALAEEVTQVADDHMSRMLADDRDEVQQLGLAINTTHFELFDGWVRASNACVSRTFSDSDWGRRRSRRSAARTIRDRLGGDSAIGPLQRGMNARRLVVLSLLQPCWHPTSVEFYTDARMLGREFASNVGSGRYYGLYNPVVQTDLLTPAAYLFQSSGEEMDDSYTLWRNGVRSGLHFSRMWKDDSSVLVESAKSILQRNGVDVRDPRHWQLQLFPVETEDDEGGTLDIEFVDSKNRKRGESDNTIFSLRAQIGVDNAVVLHADSRSKWLPVAGLTEEDVLNPAPGEKWDTNGWLYQAVVGLEWWISPFEQLEIDAPNLRDEMVCTAPIGYENEPQNEQTIPTYRAVWWWVIYMYGVGLTSALPGAPNASHFAYCRVLEAENSRFEDAVASEVADRKQLEHLFAGDITVNQDSEALSELVARVATVGQEVAEWERQRIEHTEEGPDNVVRIDIDDVKDVAAVSESFLEERRLTAANEGYLVDQQPPLLLPQAPERERIVLQAADKGAKTKQAPERDDDRQRRELAHHSGGDFMKKPVEPVGPKEVDTRPYMEIARDPLLTGLLQRYARNRERTQIEHEIVDELVGEAAHEHSAVPVRPDYRETKTRVEQAQELARWTQVSSATQRARKKEKKPRLPKIARVEKGSLVLNASDRTADSHLARQVAAIDDLSANAKARREVPTQEVESVLRFLAARHELTDSGALASLLNDRETREEFDTSVHDDPDRQENEEEERLLNISEAHDIPYDLEAYAGKDDDTDGGIAINVPLDLAEEPSDADIATLGLLGFTPHQRRAIQIPDVEGLVKMAEETRRQERALRRAARYLDATDTDDDGHECADDALEEPHEHADEDGSDEADEEYSDEDGGDEADEEGSDNDVGGHVWRDRAETGRETWESEAHAVLCSFVHMRDRFRPCARTHWAVTRPRDYPQLVYTARRLSKPVDHSTASL